ncbi:MAG: hypothetical protein R2713_11565 [Ilumatobacteraceae bacterium]
MVTGNSCAIPINPSSTCSFDVAFTPTEAGHRTASVLALTEFGQYTSVLVNGDGYRDAELALAEPEVRAGDDIGLGGAGFRPLSTVVLTWADGRGDPMTVTTDAQEPSWPCSRPGRPTRPVERTMVATGGDQVARVDVRIERSKRLDERATATADRPAQASASVPDRNASAGNPAAPGSPIAVHVTWNVTTSPARSSIGVPGAVVVEPLVVDEVERERRTGTHHRIALPSSPNGLRIVMSVISSRLPSGTVYDWGSLVAPCDTVGGGFDELRIALGVVPSPPVSAGTVVDVTGCCGSTDTTGVRGDRCRPPRRPRRRRSPVAPPRTRPRRRDRRRRAGRAVAADAVGQHRPLHEGARRGRRWGRPVGRRRRGRDGGARRSHCRFVAFGFRSLAAAGFDAECRRVEVAVEAAGRVDQVHPAAGLGVALVVDHHLEHRTTTAAQGGLQHGDDAVVGGRDVEGDLGLLDVVRGRSGAPHAPRAQWGRRWCWRAAAVTPPPGRSPASPTDD